MNNYATCPVCGGPMCQPGLKSCHGCRTSIRRVQQYNRCVRIIRLIARDQSMKAIAHNFGVSLKTIEYHWAITKRILGIRTQVGAALYALRHNLLSLNINPIIPMPSHNAELRCGRPATKKDMI